MTGIISSEEILDKLTNLMLVLKNQHVLINGPERSGKTTLATTFADTLKKDGWSTIVLTPDQFDFSKDLYEQFISILLMGIRKKVGEKEFLSFLKSRNLKNIVRKKIKTNNRAVAFRYFFNQKYINYDIDKNELLNTQTLIEINEVISKLHINLLLIFNDFESCDLVSDLSEYRVIRKIKKYLTNAKMITTFSFTDLDSISEDIKVKLSRNFDSIIDLNKERLMFKHPNLQVNHFIKKMKIHDLFLINSINESLTLPEKWLKRNFRFHEKYESKILYFDELYFVLWYLHYLRVEKPKQFNIIIENIKLFDFLRRDILSSEEIDKKHNLGNLKYIKLLLKTRGYEFETDSKYFEILKMIDMPFKSDNPILITIEPKKDILNIVNEYAFMFIFDCVFSNVENVIENDKAETLLVHFEDDQRELELFARCLNPRSLKQITTSKDKEIYDSNVFKIISDLINKI
ncbi:hypothetical protein [Spiroplasma endosymbiont of Diplazon laetatorius]|uniref:hypothetical protein n=1 Tax=Spiroplasma endosymbiont of Diplazon laetatorius TaxID=3066322 RepID=UPI0030CD1AAB